MNTTPTPAPTMLRALVGLPPLTRETLSHLLIDPTTAHMLCVPAPEHGAPFGGPVDTSVPLGAQIQALEDSGLWGTISRTPVQHDGHDAWRLQLWDTDKERLDWTKRVRQAKALPQAAEMLTLAAEVKLATWRRELAITRMRQAAWNAEDAGISRTDQINLAQVARATLYAFHKARPDDLETGDTEIADIPTTQRDTTLDWTPAPTAEPIPQSNHAPNHDSDTAPDSGPNIPRTINRGAPGELVKMPDNHTEPCTICATPATDWYGGQPTHRGECLRQLRERDTAQATSDPQAPTDTATPQPTTPKRSARTRATTSTPRRAPARRASRYTALATALDARHMYLPGGEVRPWRGATIGEIAMLVAEHSLGHGGGKSLPDRGEIWLYPDALRRLDLPLEPPTPTGATSRADRAQAAQEFYSALNELPAVAEALTDGWELDQGRLAPRTRIFHPQLLPAGAHLVMPTWSYWQDTELLQDQDQQLLPPPVLVDRLQEFADTLGIAWRITDGVTCLDLIDHTRTPRRDHHQDMGRTICVVRNEPAELPPFLRERGRTPRQVEANFSWWRAWDNLIDNEKQATWVHAYDHRSHFLNPWNSTDLGVEGLTHLEGTLARWDGTEKPAYFRVSRWDWPDWSMPDPGTAGYAIIEDTIWVTAHTLRQMEKITPGITDTLTFHEAYTWNVQARYLSGAGKLMAQARNTAPNHIADTVKSMYAAGTQKLASTEARPNYHLFRPDWRDMIIGASRTAIVATLLDARERAGALPLVVDRDTIIYASNDPDPATAWPGNPNKYGSASGGWRAIATAPLAEWGPQALTGRKGMWRYAQHVAAMTKAD